MSDKLRDQINELIRDEIQDVINDYVDAQEETQKAGLGFVGKEDEKELKVNIRKSEVDKLIKEYKKIKKIFLFIVTCFAMDNNRRGF